MKRIAQVMLAGALSFSMCPAGIALADDVAIEDAKTKIEAIKDVGPMTLSAADAETIANISTAQAAYDKLSQGDKDTLNATYVKGVSTKTKPYARLLESASWSMELFAETDNSTTLPDGAYPEGITASSDMGAYNPSTPRAWSVRDVFVKGGKAYGTVFVEPYGTYPQMRTSNELFEGKTEEAKIDVDGEQLGKDRSYYENVPLVLNGTITFAVKGSSFGGTIPYKLTTKLDMSVVGKKAAEYAALALQQKLAALPQAVTLGNADAVASARAYVDALGKDVEAQIPTDIMKRLADAESAIAELQAAADKAAADKAAAGKVAKAIKALPKTVTDTDKKAVAAARKAYDALNADARKLVSAAKIKALKAAEKAVKATKTINKKTVTASAVKKAATKGITTIVLGSKVKNINAKAFAKATKVKTLVVKSTKLAKKKCANCLKSSKIETVKVPKAKKAAYKKAFAKAASGKKVSVGTL